MQLWKRTSASLAVVDRFVAIAVESFLAVVTVASICIMATLNTHSSTHVSRQFVQLHVEAACARVKITLARCIQHILFIMYFLYDYYKIIIIIIIITIQRRNAVAFLDTFDSD